MRIMFLIQKYTQYKAAQAEQQKRKVTEKELSQLNHKIDKLLSKLDEHEPEIAENQDDECVICVSSRATMQTYPCGHRVVCRKCFVKTIQMAVAQRLLPLRCVICRAKILRLKHAAITGPLTTSASQYTIGNNWYHVPQSASLYSVSSSMSGVSGISGVSGVSSASSCSSSSYKTCASSFSSASLKKRSYTKQGYQPLRTSSPSPSRSPQSNTGDISSRTPSIKSQGQSKELSVKSTQLPSNTKSNQGQAQEPPVRGKLSLIQEFQREFRNGKSKAVNERKGSAGSGSTRIKCAKLLVNQAQPSYSGRSNGKSESVTNLGTTSGNAKNIGFRRATPPPTSQSCHSFRLSRHDSVAPVSSSFKKGKGSLQTIPDDDPSDDKTEQLMASSHNTPAYKLYSNGNDSK